MRRLLPLLLLLLLLAGCSGMTRQPAGDAQKEAQAAMDEFWKDLEQDGDITNLRGSILSGTTTMQSLNLTFGRNGVLHVLIETPSGTSSEIYCDDRYTTLVTGEEAAMFRTGCWGPEGFLVAHTSYAAQFAVRNTTVESAQRDGDVLEAKYRPEEGSKSGVRYEAEIRDGRITKLNVGSNETSNQLQGSAIEFTVTYGERDVQVPPPGARRVPAGLASTTQFGNRTYHWTVIGNSSVRLDPIEFEVHVVPGGGPPSAPPLANFTFRDGVDQVSGGFTFRFTDDGDGILDKDDRFTISNPDWADQQQYQVVVWDAWAQAPISPSPVPGVGFALTLLALAGLASWRR